MGFESLLVQGFREEAAKSKDPRDSLEAEFDVAYPTGFLGFDFTNGVKVKVQNLEKGLDFTYNSVGLVDGSMVSCVGRSGCGKTTFVLQSAGSIVRPFKNSAIFHEDIEGGASSMRTRQLLQFNEEEFKGKYIHRNTGITTENFYHRIKTIHDMKLANRKEFEYDTGLYDTDGNRIIKLQPTVVILDSLAMLMPEDLIGDNKDDLSGGMAATSIAKLNTQLIKTIIPMLKAAGIIFFCINHILPDPSPVPKKAQVAWLKIGERCPGGETAIYLANNFLRFNDGSKLTMTKDGLDGIEVDIVLVKSRTNNAGKEVPMILDYANGFDADLSLFELLKKMGAVKGAGAYLYFDGYEDMKFSRKKFKEKLATEPDFVNAFATAALKELDKLTSSIAVDMMENDMPVVSSTSTILDMMKSQIAA